MKTREILPSSNMFWKYNPMSTSQIDALLEKENVAYDINGYRDAPPGLRIWAGATVETGDLEALFPWLDWAFATAKADTAAAV